MMTTFVDNIKIIEVKSLRMIGYVKKELIVIFEIVDMGSISFYLDFKISQNYKSKIINFS